MDSDDDNSSVSSSSTTRSDRVSVVGTEEVQLDKESLLEQALDALFEKRYFFCFLPMNETLFCLFVKFLNLDCVETCFIVKLASL
jgi:hypothetical protein